MTAMKKGSPKPRQQIRLDHASSQQLEATPDVTPSTIAQRVMTVPPTVWRATDILALQRTVGNRAVQRTLTLQRLAKQQVDYDDDEAEAVRAERANDRDAVSNYATISFTSPTQSDSVTRRSQSGFHAELNAWNGVAVKLEQPPHNINISVHDPKLAQNNVTIDSVYSERKPCATCEEKLDQHFGMNNVPAFYTVKYKESWELKEKEIATQELQKYINDYV